MGSDDYKAPLTRLIALATASRGDALACLGREVPFEGPPSRVPEIERSTGRV